MFPAGEGKQTWSQLSGFKHIQQFLLSVDRLLMSGYCGPQMSNQIFSIRSHRLNKSLRPWNLDVFLWWKNQRRQKKKKLWRCWFRWTCLTSSSRTPARADMLTVLRLNEHDPATQAQLPFPSSGLHNKRLIIAFGKRLDIVRYIYYGASEVQLHKTFSSSRSLLSYAESWADCKMEISPGACLLFVLIILLLL